jgi:hypothetical protein
MTLAFVETDKKATGAQTDVCYQATFLENNKEVLFLIDDSRNRILEKIQKGKSIYSKAEVKLETLVGYGDSTPSVEWM